MDLNRLILGKSYNSTKVFRTAQHVVQAILLGIVVPLLILLLIWDLTDNPNPVPAVVVIAGLVMLCFFFSYVFFSHFPILLSKQIFASVSSDNTGAHFINL